MKKLTVLSVMMLFALQAKAECVNPLTALIQCQNGSILTNLGCQVATEVTCKKSNDLNDKAYIVGKLEGSLVGELDPYVLGDGGLFVLRLNNNKLVTVFEPLEDAGTTLGLRAISQMGGVIAIAKGTVERASKREIRIMRDLKENVMMIPGRSQYFSILD